MDRAADHTSAKSLKIWRREWDYKRHPLIGVGLTHVLDF